MTSRAAQVFAAALAIADAGGVAVCITIQIADLVRGRSIGGLTWLIAPTVVLLSAGQIWTIVNVNRRRRMSPGDGLDAGVAGYAGRWRRRSPRVSPSDMWRALLGPVDRRVVVAVAVLFYGSIIDGITAFARITDGNPTTATPDCRYPLSDHGAITCVSEHTYDLVGAAQQRFAVCVLGGFFAVHLGAALGSLVEKRSR